MTLMKTSNRLSILSKAIGCLILVALGGTAAAAFSTQSNDEDGGPGNQECNTTSVEKAIGPVKGSGSAFDGDSDEDYDSAKYLAERDFEKKVGDATGFVCKKCEDDRRCRRNPILTAGAKTWNFIEIPATELHDGGWKVEITWTGKCKIKCEAC